MKRTQVMVKGQGQPVRKVTYLSNAEAKKIADKKDLLFGKEAFKYS